jgi:uncharacterized protein YgiM (DUF1202 family)
MIMSRFRDGLVLSVAGLFMAGSATLFTPAAQATTPEVRPGHVATQAESEAATCRYRVVTRHSKLKVHRGPGLRYRIIGKLARHTIVRANCKSTNGFVKLRSGKFAYRGWVARRWLDRI